MFRQGPIKVSKMTQDNYHFAQILQQMAPRRLGESGSRNCHGMSRARTVHSDGTVAPTPDILDGVGQMWTNEVSTKLTTSSCSTAPVHMKAVAYTTGVHHDNKHREINNQSKGNHMIYAP